MAIVKLPTRAGGHRTAIVFLVVLWVGTTGMAAEDIRVDGGPDPCRIGLIASLFRNIPSAAIKPALYPLQALIQTETGLHADLVPVPDAESLGDQLARDKMQLGIFHGYEFACARQRHPELRPLLLVVNQRPDLYAFLVVPRDCKATSMTDLAGKTLALPRCSQEHCRLFLEFQCRNRGKEPQGFFNQIDTPATIEDALDDVVDGLIPATLVDGVALDAYQRRKPGRFARLKVIQKSEAFPTSVVTYRPGALTEAVLGSIRKGLARANRRDSCQQILTLWKITGFEPVTESYEQMLTSIVKSYPLPAFDFKGLQAAGVDLGNGKGK